MIVEKIENPWTQYLIHNFLPQDVFNEFNEYSKNLPRYESRTMHPFKEGKWHDLLVEPMSDLSDIMKYDFGRHYLELQFDNIDIDWRYNKVHTDNPKKIFTFVLGLSDTGTGTKIYKTKTQFSHQNPYIQNGGTAFFRGEHTWHDFDAIDCVEQRRTLIIMVCKKPL